MTKPTKKALAAAAPKMRRALLQVQKALAAYRDHVNYVYRGHILSLEEVKYCIVDKALKGLE